MTKITRKQIEAVLIDLSYEFPDRVAQCFYSVEEQTQAQLPEYKGWSEYDRPPVNATEPCCIVGTVVFRLAGVEGLNSLPEGRAVGYNDSGWSEGYVVPVLRELGFTEKAIIMLSRAQECQDGGASWGALVEPVVSYKDESWGKFGPVLR